MKLRKIEIAGTRQGRRKPNPEESRIRLEGDGADDGGTQTEDARLCQSSHHFAGQPIRNGQARSTQSSDHVTALPHGRSSGSGHSRDSVANLRRVATEVERRRAGTVFAGWRLPIPILLIARLSAVSGARTALDQPRPVVGPRFLDQVRIKRLYRYRQVSRLAR